MLREPTDEHGGRADPNCRKKNPLFDARATIEEKLLATEASRKFLIASLDDQAEVVRLAAAAALVATGSAAARLVLEALAATHSPNAASARIILGNYP